MDLFFDFERLKKFEVAADLLRRYPDINFRKVEGENGTTLFRIGSPEAEEALRWSYLNWEREYAGFRVLQVDDSKPTDSS